MINIIFIKNIIKNKNKKKKFSGFIEKYTIYKKK